MYGDDETTNGCTCPECSGRDVNFGDTLAYRAMSAYATLLGDERTTLVAYPMEPGLYVELVDRASDAEWVVARGRVA